MHLDPLERESAIARLDAARETIEQYGWRQRHMGSIDTGFCALGALYHHVRDGALDEPFRVARGLLISVIDAPPVVRSPVLHIHYQEIVQDGPVARWNDEPGRTREDVILAFKLAAEKAREGTV